LPQLKEHTRFLVTRVQKWAESRTSPRYEALQLDQPLLFA